MLVEVVPFVGAYPAVVVCGLKTWCYVRTHMKTAVCEQGLNTSRDFNRQVSLAIAIQVSSTSQSIQI
jgi:hypothetical protein